MATHEDVTLTLLWILSRRKKGETWARIDLVSSIPVECTMDADTLILRHTKPDLEGNVLGARVWDIPHGHEGVGRGSTTSTLESFSWITLYSGAYLI